VVNFGTQMIGPSYFETHRAVITGCVCPPGRSCAGRETILSLRLRYGITPLAPADAAVPDDEVHRNDFERPGLRPPPQVSEIGIADRPPADD